MEFKFKVKEPRKVYYVLKDNNVSETIINRLRRNTNLVLVNGQPSRVVDIAPANSEIVIKVDDKNTNKVAKESGKINVLFEDDYLIAINKPPFVASIPNKFKPSIAGKILAHTNLNTYMPINRLDYNTSGILLVAKNPLVQHKLTNNFKKCYVAILQGTLKKRIIVCNAKIGNHPTEKSLRAVDETNGKPCITIFKTIKKFKSGCSLVKIKLLTGRTHQIRIHSSFLGAPILADVDYGATATTLINRQALHAYKTEFIHPITHKKIKIKCPLPADIKGAIKELNLTDFQAEKNSNTH